MGHGCCGSVLDDINTLVYLVPPLSTTRSLRKLDIRTVTDRLKHGYSRDTCSKFKYLYHNNMALVDLPALEDLTIHGNVLELVSKGFL